MFDSDGARTKVAFGGIIQPYTARFRWRKFRRFLDPVLIALSCTTKESNRIANMNFH